MTHEPPAGAPAISLRPARPADLPACAGVWHAGLSEYGVRVGRSPMPPAFGPLIDLLGHLLATDPAGFWVAVAGDRGAIPVDGAASTIAPDGPVVAFVSALRRAGVDANAIRLALLGHQDVAVYDGGWAEWGDRLDLPLAR